MASRRYRALQARLQVLRRLFLPRRFSSTGSYGADALDRARAFRVLIHAEIEAYVEDRALEVADSAFRAWESSGRVSRPLAAMLASRPEKLNEAGLPKELGGTPFMERRVKEALGTFRQMIKNNHGVKRKDILRLLVSIGIEEIKIDSTWLNDLDGFGSDRGFVAHTTGVRSRVQYSIDPKSDLQTVERLVAEFETIDQEIYKLLRSVGT